VFYSNDQVLNILCTNVEIFKYKKKFKKTFSFTSAIYGRGKIATAKKFFCYARNSFVTAFRSGLNRTVK